MTSVWWFLLRASPRFRNGRAKRAARERLNLASPFACCNARVWLKKKINGYLALTSYCNTIGQSNNAFSISGFSLAGKRRVRVLTFYLLADKTNNEHLPKPFFKVIRKSLYFAHTLGTRYVTVHVATVLHFALSDAILKNGLDSENKRVDCPRTDKTGEKQGRGTHF